MKNAEKSLNDYEEKLGLVDRFDKTEKVINEIDNTIDKIVKEDIDKNIKEKLLNIKTMIDGINE